MKVTADRTALLAAVETAARTVKPKSGPAMESALLTASPRQLEIAASDLAIHTRTTVPAAVSAPGAVLINAKSLEDAIKSMPRGVLDLETDASNKTTLRGGRRSIELLGLSSDAYSALPDAPTEWQQLPARVLTALLTKTAFAGLQVDDGRSHLYGVMLTRDERDLVAIATDGHRLAMARAECDAAIDVLVPMRLVHEIEKLLDANEAAAVEFAVTRGMVFLRVGESILGGQRTEGTFPAWRQVIPAKGDRSARVARTSLYESVQAVARITTDKTSAITMHVKPGEIALSMANAERGAANDVVDAELEGAELRIGVNARYLNEALATTEDEDVIVEMNGELDPIVVRPAESVGQLCVVMPSRV